MGTGKVTIEYIFVDECDTLLDLSERTKTVVPLSEYKKRKKGDQVRYTRKNNKLK